MVWRGGVHLVVWWSEGEARPGGTHVFGSLESSALQVTVLRLAGTAAVEVWVEERTGQHRWRGGQVGRGGSECRGGARPGEEAVRGHERVAAVGRGHRKRRQCGATLAQDRQVRLRPGQRERRRRRETGVGREARVGRGCRRAVSLDVEPRVAGQDHRRGETRVQGGARVRHAAHVRHRRRGRRQKIRSVGLGSGQRGRLGLEVSVRMRCGQVGGGGQQTQVVCVQLGMVRLGRLRTRMSVACVPEKKQTFELEILINVLQPVWHRDMFYGSHEHRLEQDDKCTRSTSALKLPKTIC